MALSTRNLFLSSVILSIISAGFIAVLRPGDTYPIVTYGTVIPALILVVAYTARRRVLPRSAQQLLGRITLLIILLNAPGTIYFHVTGFSFQYDRILHFAVGLLVVPLVWLLLGIVRGHIEMDHSAPPLAVVFSVLGIFLWEGWQYVNDQIFNTNMFFDYGQSIRVDVTEDILFGLGGIMLWLLLRRRILFLRPRS